MANNNFLMPSPIENALEVLDNASPEELAGHTEKLAALAQKGRSKLKPALAGSGDAPAPRQAPALALLSADARRFGEAGEVFKDGGFFGPKANELTYGIPVPDQLPSITLPSQVLEACQQAGGWLRLHVDKTPEDQPLNMLAMHRLVAGRWAAAGKGKLLVDEGGWKATERFYTHGIPRAGWRVVFPDVLSGTTSEDDIRQTELLIAQVIQFFKGVPLPKHLEQAFAKFEAEKAGIRTKMEDNRLWPQASEAIEGQPVNGLIRPTPSELIDTVAVGLECAGERPLRDVVSRTPVRSSSGCLVSVGVSRPVGAGVNYGHPGFAGPPVGASLSLQS